MSDERGPDGAREIGEMVQRFIHEELLNLSGEPDFDLPDDLLTRGLVDSLGVIRLVTFLESSFSVTIAMEDVSVENFISCESIAAYILELQSKS